MPGRMVSGGLPAGTAVPVRPLRGMAHRHRKGGLIRPADSPTAGRAIIRSLGRVEPRLVKPVRGAVLESIVRVGPAPGRG
jgi:hypothetical protein